MLAALPFFEGAEPLRNARATNVRRAEIAPLGDAGECVPTRVLPGLSCLPPPLIPEDLPLVLWA
jgi:hypothetical protein